LTLSVSRCYTSLSCILCLRSRIFLLLSLAWVLVSWLLGHSHCAWIVSWLLLNMVVGLSSCTERAFSHALAVCISRFLPVTVKETRSGGSGGAWACGACCVLGGAGFCFLAGGGSGSGGSGGFGGSGAGLGAAGGGAKKAGSGGLSAVAACTGGCCRRRGRLRRFGGRRSPITRQIWRIEAYTGFSILCSRLWKEAEGCCSNKLSKRLI